ncbi:MAG: RNA polymerase sigma factor [Armatimonadetes bacterium]|nr:RNA polymerase sigma factor [Armatimonadota bacterium]
MTPTDRELMGRVRERDATAFEVLFARYRDRIRRFLVNSIHDDAAAEDLVQDVFLRVWTHAAQWDGYGPLRAWLFRIATNLALNHLRSVRRRREQPLDVPPDPEDPYEESPAPGWMLDATTLGPAEALERSERRRRLRRLIAELPEEKRTVIRLIHEEEMNIRAAAGALGVPEGTVKSRLHYARKQLARGWRRIEAEEEVN